MRYWQMIGHKSNYYGAIFGKEDKITEIQNALNYVEDYITEDHDLETIAEESFANQFLNKQGMATDFR